LTVREFLKIFHPKQNAKSFLPLELRRLIIDYLKEPKAFYVQDLGSVHGTYIKVANERFDIGPMD
jgi:hypothetical protein